MDNSLGVDFQLTSAQKELQQLARAFARQEIAPVAEHYDRTHEFPYPILKKAHELGLHMMNVPEALGGLGLSLLEEILVCEELGWACTGVTTALIATGLGWTPILLAGSAEQQKEYGGRISDGQMCAYCVTEPEAGSDVAGIRTTARKEGDDYILNGTKTFITGAPQAHFYTVFAYTDVTAKHKGLSAFIVERDWEGISVSQPFAKMGQHASSTAAVTFDNVRVPATHLLGSEGQGFLIAMQVFDRSRPGTATIAVGLAQRALDESVNYAQTRVSFGLPIYQHQAVGHMIAEMAMQVEAARLLVWKAASLYDAGLPNTKAASFAKAYAADVAMKVATDAVQVFGGYGYMAEYPVEKLMRDAKIFQIYEGTSQIQRNIIVRELFHTTKPTKKSRQG